MKKRIHFCIVLVFCCAATALAQQNNPISYQAVVRDASNHLVTATPLSVAVKLTDNNNGFYEERHYVTSNNNGMISLWVGNGEDQSGNWKGLKWDKVTAEMKIYRVSNGELIATHTTPISAVPYALYAETVNMDTIINYIEEHPFEQKNADWEATSGVEEILHKPTIPVVNDGLLNVVIDGDTTKFTANQAATTTVNIPNPTIPEVNDGHLNIIFGGGTVVFTANQSTNTTVNIDSLIRELEKRIDSLSERLTILEEAADTFDCGTTKVKDSEGNLYETVLINSKCWMRTNMRATKTLDGENIITRTKIRCDTIKLIVSITADTSLAIVCDTTSTSPLTVVCDTLKSYAFRIDTITTVSPVKYDTVYLDSLVVRFDTTYRDSLDYDVYCYYVNSSTNDPNCYLYNWNAAREICPRGWHLPTVAEWDALISFMNGRESYKCSGTTDYLAKSLADTSNWVERTNANFPCEVGYNQKTNNKTGFSAYPAGEINMSGFDLKGKEAVIWLDIADGSGNATCVSLLYDTETVQKSINPDPHHGFSVRCIRD